MSTVATTGPGLSPAEQELVERYRSARSRAAKARFDRLAQAALQVWRVRTCKTCPFRLRQHLVVPQRDEAGKAQLEIWRGEQLLGSVATE